jgi:hypothetical protein
MVDEPEAEPPAPAAPPTSSPATPAQPATTTVVSVPVPEFVTDWRSIREYETGRPNIIEKK